MDASMLLLYTTLWKKKCQNAGRLLGLCKVKQKSTTYAGLPGVFAVSEEVCLTSTKNKLFVHVEKIIVQGLPGNVGISSQLHAKANKCDFTFMFKRWVAEIERALGPFCVKFACSTHSCTGVLFSGFQSKRMLDNINECLRLSLGMHVNLQLCNSLATCLRFTLPSPNTCWVNPG